MAKAGLLALTVLCWASGTAAKDVDYDKIDYGKYARPERQILAKCFEDMLAVVRRHKLRNQLVYFLEAGCQSEMRTVEAALGKNRFPGLEGLSDDLRGKTLGPMFIGPMEQAAEEIYKKQQASFCTGDSCVLDAYRKCVMSQAAEELGRQINPASFEIVLKTKCMVPEVTARSTLTNDFLGVQKLQRNPALSDKTRELIDAVVRDIRQEAVSSYAEQLVKAQPGRKSCRVPVEMCGQEECISLDEVPKAQREYECAIQK